MIQSPFNCHFELTLELIGGKWKGLILWHLMEKKVLRNGEMLRLMPRITQKMLTQQLREMEENGLVSRIIYEQVPPKVEYRLTSHGESLRPILNQMIDWGVEYAQDKKIMIACTKQKD
ncbi:MAG: helix-turn-helix domain-containing protein [Sulfuricurvum sp.]|uniref:winged helix-turn-helix transcriptional regulator n=1 Tax=Sulfuricurvum sp. TaxID=2025608 RepID=UPI00262C4410|nr:helix-turn-helix domain-containing protein [Sulfuricurvum sp.]MDD2369023.1 helix-turn-helix domain-containing protein [Sulfuricurvum sp.]MDD5117873.1 helix-turn-helix domain-containing protein [Sulfuricurvum sp.]